MIGKGSEESSKEPRGVWVTRVTSNSPFELDLEQGDNFVARDITTVSTPPMLGAKK
jgi:hypothetical protein